METEEKTMEELQPRTLLKAKDGSEYIVFMYYLDTSDPRKQKKSDTPTELFSGYFYGDDGKRRYPRKVSDYRIADKIDQSLLDTFLSLRVGTWQKYDEYCKLVEASERMQDVYADVKDNAPKHLQSAIDTIDKMKQGIDYVMQYTGKDYVKGEEIAKQLTAIKPRLTLVQKDIENIGKPIQTLEF